MSYEQIFAAQKVIENELKTLINAAEVLKIASTQYRYRPILAVEREKILKRLYDYLLNGYSFQDAKNRLYSDFDKTADKIDEICDSYYAYHVAQLRPMKIYAAKYLKAAGHTNKEIARLLDITAQTVSKYLLLANRS